MAEEQGVIDALIDKARVAQQKIEHYTRSGRSSGDLTMFSANGAATDSR